MSELAVLSYAVAGVPEGTLPEHRIVPLPPPGEHRRRARLPGLASSLASAALGGEPAPVNTSVILGTALGSLTETAAFVENMLRLHEEMPRPRAFSTSVHNATTSQVARRIGARGECQTYTHGELSFHQALFAGTRVRGSTRVLVGAIDETSAYVERATRHCASPPSAEGGAVFWCTGADQPGPVLARLRPVAQARPRHPRRWIEEQLAGLEIDQILWPFETEWRRDLGGEVTTAQTGHHLSSTASATALAVAAQAGEAELPWRSRRSLAVVTAARGGEVAILLVERG